MDKIVKEAELPFSARTVFNAVADLTRFPQIFPTIRSAKILGGDDKGQEVEMAFNVSPVIASVLGGSTQTLRAVMTPDSEISLSSIPGKGAMKEMNIRWTFTEKAQDRTQVKFEMEFDPGRKPGVNATVKAYVALNARNVIENLENHIRKTAPQAP